MTYAPLTSRPRFASDHVHLLNNIQGLLNTATHQFVEPVVRYLLAVTFLPFCTATFDILNSSPGFSPASAIFWRISGGVKEDLSTSSWETV
jgi:hypothetical protein